MTNLKEKKNIIFDLGNVVIDIDLNITMERLKDLGFKSNGNFLNKYKQSGVFSDFEEGKISGSQFVDQLKTDLNPGVSDNQVIDAWNALMLNYTEERIETILKLKETHKVFILSNTNSLHIEYCANRVPIVGSLDLLFDKTYYSFEMNMSKPNANIFQTLLKDANIKAEETLFLDDSIVNVEVAEKLGIESWLVEYPDQWVSKIKELM